MASRVTRSTSSIFGGSGAEAPVLTRIIVPRDNALTARSTYSNSADAIFARRSHDQLTSVRDAEAMQKLADGHTEAFNQYARDRVSQSTTPQEKAYWQQLLDRSGQKLEDDTMAAGIKDGSVSLEQLRDHLKARADKVGPQHPDYAAYVTEIGKVGDSIKARDFNADVTKAQNDYYGSGDKTAYKNALVGFLSRTTDSNMHQALRTQIDTVQRQIDTEGVTQRVADASRRISSAYDGDTKPHEVIDYLNDAASKAKTTQEAQWYANEAQKMAAFDRQQTKAAIGSAAGSGSAAALKSTLLDANDTLRAAESAVHSEIVKQGKPTDATWQAFDSAHKDYTDALTAALPGASAKNKDAIIKEQARITSQYDTQFKEVGQAIVKTAEDAATQLAGTAKSFSTQTEKGDYSAVSAARYEWAKAYSDATSSPFLNDAQKRTLQDKITTGPLAAQAGDIQRNLAALREVDPTTGQVTLGPNESKVKDTSLRGEYEKYTSAFDNAPLKPGGQQITANPVSYEQFVGLAGSSATFADIKKGLFGPNANVAAWLPSDLNKLKSDATDYNASLDKEQQTAQDKQDQSIAAIVQLTKSHQPDLRDDQNIAASNANFDPSEYGPTPVDPTALVSAPGGFGRPGSDKAMGGYQSGGQNAEAQPGDGTTSFAPGYDPTFGDQASAGDSPDLTSFDSASNASAEARMNAHLRGHDFLDSQTPIDLPTWSLPEMPTESPFLAGYDATQGDTASLMPAAPDANMPPPPSMALDFPDAPFIA